MSSYILDNLTTVWETNGTELWSLCINAAPSFIGENNLIMEITAQKGSEGDPRPYARRLFDPPLDLSRTEEIRFWLRSSRIGDGSQRKPFYLSFEVSNNPPNPDLSWSRLLQINRTGKWDIHKLWIGDMPANLRQSVGFLQFRSLDPTVEFNASTSSIVAVTAEPLQDMELSMFERLNNRFQVIIENQITEVPALIYLPENPSQIDPPYILITPLSIKPSKYGTGDVIDNYTTNGVFFRPVPTMFQLEYIITVYAQERSQKVHLLETILSDFSKTPYLFVNGERLDITPFLPSTEEVSYLNSLGQTPLFYRVNVFIETGDRKFRPLAVPFLKTAPISEKEEAEVINI